MIPLFKPLIFIIIYGAKINTPAFHQIPWKSYGLKFRISLIKKIIKKRNSIFKFFYVAQSWVFLNKLVKIYSIQKSVNTSNSVIYLIFKFYFKKNYPQNSAKSEGTEAQCLCRFGLANSDEAGGTSSGSEQVERFR